MIKQQGAKAVHNEFEEERSAAVQTHLSAGFTRYWQENRILELLITKEQYFRQKRIFQPQAQREMQKMDFNEMKLYICTNFV